MPTTKRINTPMHRTYPIRGKAAGLRCSRIPGQWSQVYSARACLRSCVRVSDSSMARHTPSINQLSSQKQTVSRRQGRPAVATVSDAPLLDCVDWILACLSLVSQTWRRHSEPGPGPPQRREDPNCQSKRFRLPLDSPARIGRNSQAWACVLPLGLVAGTRAFAGRRMPSSPFARPRVSG